MAERIKLQNQGVDGRVNVVAEKSEQVVGSTIALLFGKTALLEDLYVSRNIENRGIVANILMRETERLAIEQGATQIMRIGLFCDSESIAEYVRTVKLLQTRGYKYWLVGLTKQLAPNRL